MKHNTATLISRVCDPFVMLTIVFVMLLWGSPVFLPAFFLMVLVPFLVFFVAWKSKIISNWDVTDRKERPKILWSLVAIELVAMLFFHTIVLIPILIAIVGFTLITHVWKISGHSMGVAMATGEVVLRFGWKWWPVFLVVPLVGWARVMRKDHTVIQVIMGALYSWGVLWVFHFLS